MSGEVPAAKVDEGECPVCPAAHETCGPFERTLCVKPRCANPHHRGGRIGDGRDDDQWQGFTEAVMPASELRR